jgi:hypothetical protein
MEESYHIYDCSAQEIARMGFGIFEGTGKVKRVDTLIRVQVDIEVCPSHSIHERTIFVFWIEDDHISTEHEGTEYFELHSK